MRPRLVVGIAGGSASGKSTLTNALADALRALPNRQPAILATDRYVHGDPARGPSFHFRATGALMFDWNHPASVDWPQLLRDLDAQLAAADGPDILLVEGLMVLHEPTLRARLDLCLFVELDADERALRRLLRNMRRGGELSDPAFIASYYNESARVGHARYVEPSRIHADLIVRGDADWARLQPLLLAVIEDCIRRVHAHSTSYPER